MKKDFVIFFCAFIIIFCASMFLFSLHGDEIWNYGFAYNLSRGLVPYRDFNMIVPPFYSFIIALIIKIFGNHLYLMVLVNSLIASFTLLMIYKKIGYKFIVFSPMLLYLSTINGYNFFCIFLVVLLLYLYDKEFKYKDFILGLIVSIMILTKQTVGGLMFIPMFFLCEHKIKYLIGVFIPCLLFLIYLLCFGALYSFIDYCFLGMFGFTEKNYYQGFLFLVLAFVVLLLVLYFTKKVDKSVFIVLAFQIMTAPIFDFYHSFCGIFICVYYLFCKVNLHGFFTVFLLCLSFVFLICSFEKPSLILDKKSFLYGKNTQIKSDAFRDLYETYEEYKKQYDNIFVFSSYSFEIKMYLNYNITKFDLINYGNTGYNGGEKLIKEIDNICKKESCLFMIDYPYVDVVTGESTDYVGQIDLNIINYVVSEYNLIDFKYILNIYSN